MIIRNEEHKRKTVENLLGGSGKAHFKNIIETPEELYGSARFWERAMPAPMVTVWLHVGGGVPTACQIQIKVKQTSPHFLAAASAPLAAARRLRARRQGIPLLPA